MITESLWRRHSASEAHGSRRMIGVSTVQISSLYVGANRLERRTVPGVWLESARYKYPVSMWAPIGLKGAQFPAYDWSQYGTNIQSLCGRQSAWKAHGSRRMTGVSTVQISSLYADDVQAVPVPPQGRRRLQRSWGSRPWSCCTPSA